MNGIRMFSTMTYLELLRLRFALLFNFDLGKTELKMTSIIINSTMCDRLNFVGEMIFISRSECIHNHRNIVKLERSRKKNKNVLLYVFSNIKREYGKLFG